MTFTHVIGYYDSPGVNDDSMDVEFEFYNVPDERIINMLEEAYFESE